MNGDLRAATSTEYVGAWHIIAVDTTLLIRLNLYLSAIIKRVAEIATLRKSVSPRAWVVNCGRTFGSITILQTTF